MSSYVSLELRNAVAARAQYTCEYCLIHEDDAVYGCHVDHVISLKHGGATESSNLAYACVFCNRYKGSDIGSILFSTKEFVRFFNPRTDTWSSHFMLKESLISPITAIGEVTAKILDFNNFDRILEREMLISIGRYPPALNPQEKE